MPASPATDKVSNAIRIAVAVVLGGIGAAAGFTHTHDWAAHHGQAGWLAWADAVVIEGIAIVAGFELHHDHHRRKTTGRRVSFPLLVLVAGFGVQMTAQVADAERSPAGWLLAAMPALGFLTVVKLLIRRIPTPPTQPAPKPAPAPSTTRPPQRETPPAPVPTPETEPTPALEPAPEPLRPVTPTRPTRLRLPAGMHDLIAAAADKATDEGRALTTADIRAAARVSESLAQQILTDLQPA